MIVDLNRMYIILWSFWKRCSPWHFFALKGLPIHEQKNFIQTIGLLSWLDHYILAWENNLFTFSSDSSTQRWSMLLSLPPLLLSVELKKKKNEIEQITIVYTHSIRVVLSHALLVYSVDHTSIEHLTRLFLFQEYASDLKKRTEWNWAENSNIDCVYVYVCDRHEQKTFLVITTTATADIKY